MQSDSAVSNAGSGVMKVNVASSACPEREKEGVTSARKGECIPGEAARAADPLRIPHRCWACK